VHPREGGLGRSSVQLTVLGSVDAGTYTCLARNSVGFGEQNFTLDVRLPQAAQASAAVVTETTSDGSVHVGERATLRCRVRAAVTSAKPNIKWLKRMGESESDNADKVVSVHTLNMGNERYRVLDNPNPDVRTGQNEYLNRLVIPSAGPDDEGLYICFVTNGGFGALTYKSATLKVEPRRRMNNDVVVAVNPHENRALDAYLLVVVVALVAVTFLCGLAIVICIVKRGNVSNESNAASLKCDGNANGLPFTSLTSSSNNNSGNSSSGSRTCYYPDMDEQHAHYLQQQRRPFLMDDKYDTSSGVLLPPPPSGPGPSYTPSSATTLAGQWSRTVYPAAQPQPPTAQIRTFGRSPLSPSCNHYETPLTVANQYEVPYSHVQRHPQPRSSVSNGNIPLHLHRPRPAGGSVVALSANNKKPSPYCQFFDGYEA